MKGPKGKRKFAKKMFSDGKKAEQKQKSKTQNNATAYATSGSRLTDINFIIPKLRLMPESELRNLWRKVYKEDPRLALRWLFFLRDIRGGGIGERVTFRRILKHLNPLLLAALIEARIDPNDPSSEFLIPFYGRWDDLFDMYNVNDATVQKAVINVMREQLKSDINNMEENKPISIMAKWAPSPNCSNDARRQLAGKLANGLGMKSITYKRMLSSLKERLDIYEVKVSSHRSDEIEYEKMPSRSFVLHRRSFLRNDAERYKEYLENVKKGTKPINVANNYPYEIFTRVRNCNRNHYDIEEINYLQLLWDKLPGFDENRATLVIADGSDSMKAKIKRTQSSYRDVAFSLAVKAAQSLPEPYHNKFMVFSEHPMFVDISDCSDIGYIETECEKYTEAANTNIAAAMALILDTAITHNISNDALPNVILIISDMQFDEITDNPDLTVFENIERQYNKAGYKMPEIIFWNVAQNTDNVYPMQTAKNGVKLISGYSQNAYRIATTNCKDPYEALVSILMDSRYDPVEEVFKQKSTWSYVNTPVDAPKYDMTHTMNILNGKVREHDNFPVKRDFHKTKGRMNNGTKNYRKNPRSKMS